MKRAVYRDESSGDLSDSGGTPISVLTDAVDGGSASAPNVLIDFRRDTAANWTSSDPTLADGEPGYETDTGKVKFGDGATAWSGLAYFSGATSGVDSIDGITGPVSLVAGSNITITDDSPSPGDITISATGGGGGGGIGSSELVYRYTVTGSDKASIDTGVDTPAAGSNDWTNGDLLEATLYCRTDDAAVVGDALLTFNNDTGATQYLAERLRSNTNLVSSAANTGAANIDVFVAGASLDANFFSQTRVVVPNYRGTVGYKPFEVVTGAPSATAGNANNLSYACLYKSTSALSRLAFTANSGKKFKVGTQLLIYKRLAS